MMRALARTAARILPQRAKAGLARWRFGHGDAGPRITVERRRDGASIRYTIADALTLVAAGESVASVEYHFADDGDSRAEMISFMSVSSSASRDALLLDVGAHVGLFSVVHLALGPEHRAVLFEPSPLLSSGSREWLRLNGMTGRADARLCGVADLVETRAIETDDLGFAQAARHPASGVAVQFTTIDHVCRSERLAPAIIKIDVEGYEPEVLDGARETLARDRPVLCLELHLDVLEQRGKSLALLLDALEAAGYVFESTAAQPMSAAQIRRSLKAVLRIVARPAA
jgi:FkbM family methyltransferase